MTIETGDRTFSPVIDSERREFWRQIEQRAGAVVIIGTPRSAGVEQFVTETYDELRDVLDPKHYIGVPQRSPSFVEVHVIASRAPSSQTASIDDLVLMDPPLRRLFPTSAIVLVRPVADRAGAEREGDVEAEARETVPFIRYDCETVENDTQIAANGGPLTVSAGGIVCSVYTNDNDDDGSMRHAESWTTSYVDRAAFDRNVGKSRQGVIARCDVMLDGKRVE